MIGGVLDAYGRSFHHVCTGIGWIVLKLESFYLMTGVVFSILCRLLTGGVTNCTL